MSRLGVLQHENSQYSLDRKEGNAQWGPTMLETLDIDWTTTQASGHHLKVGGSRLTVSLVGIALFGLN